MPPHDDGFPQTRIRRFRENGLFHGDRNASNKNACVGFNGGPYDLHDYAEGYFYAASLIFEGARRPGAIVDLIVYPACYNFRHGLELYVKYMAESLATILGEKEGYKLGHRMLDNWELAMSAAKELPEVIFQDDEVRTVDQTIREFCEVDPVGQIFRYPESIKREMHLKDWSVINLIVVENRLKAVQEILKEWHYRIEGCLDALREARAAASSGW